MDFITAPNCPISTLFLITSFIYFIRYITAMAFSVGASKTLKSSVSDVDLDNGTIFKKRNDVDPDDGTIFREGNGKKIHWAPGDRVQPLGSADIFNAIGAFYGELNTVQAIWLKSKQPIEVKNIETALWILSRQVPHLQFCFSRKGIQLWFRRMKKFVLDFETSTDDVMEVYKQMLETKYDLWKGPLWKVKMVVTNGNDCFGDGQDGYCNVLIFSVHHVITDGNTNMKICREIVSILNQMSKGLLVSPKPVPLSPTIDEITNGPTVPLHYLVKRFVTKSHEFFLKSSAGKLTLGENLSGLTIKNGKTKVLFSDFTKEESSQILTKCKESKVTVHSFVVTAANFALLKIAQSESITPIGRKTINVMHYINMRRYFSPEFKDSSGCHISGITEKYNVTLTDSENFLEPASNVYSSMKRQVDETKGHMKDISLVKFAGIVFPVNHMLMKNGMKNRMSYNYGTTNMGNLKDLLPEPGADDSIEITHLRRSVSIALMDYPFLLTFHTFRDDFMISIDYSTNKIAEGAANAFFLTLCQFLRNLGKFGTIYGIVSN